MQISFSPVRMDARLEASISGDVLTLNGETFDFTDLPEGATLPREAVTCDWLASDVERVGGELLLTLILPHGANALEASRFPEVATVTSGVVPLPVYDIEPEGQT